jgi:ABC-type transporter Mla subunit MlaD
MDADAISLVVRARDDASAAFASIHQSLDTLNSKAGSAGKAMSAFQDILKGIGMGIGMAVFNDLQQALGKLVNLFPQLVGQAQTFAASVHQLSLDTGASSEQASRLIGIYTYLGLSTDGLSTKMGVLSKYIIAHAQTMQDMGIATTDANGVMLNTATIIDNARQVLSAAVRKLRNVTIAATLSAEGGSCVETKPVSDRVDAR